MHAREPHGGPERVALTTPPPGGLLVPRGTSSPLLCTKCQQLGQGLGVSQLVGLATPVHADGIAQHGYCRMVTAISSRGHRSSTWVARGAVKPGFRAGSSPTTCRGRPSGTVRDPAPAPGSPPFPPMQTFSKVSTASTDAGPVLESVSTHPKGCVEAAAVPGSHW